MRPRLTEFIAHAAFECRVRGRERVEDGRHGRRSVYSRFDSEVQRGRALDEIAQLVRDTDSNVHGDQVVTGAARTDITGGRCWASSRHVSPSSVDPYTSPERVPK